MANEKDYDTDECSSSIKGQDNLLRAYVSYEGVRRGIFVPNSMNIAEMKKLVRNIFRVDSKQANLGDENQQKNILVISYYGSELHDDWVLADLGLQHGATLKAYIKEEFDPVFFFYVGYKKETFPVLDRLKLRDFSVADLRGMASRKTGLPVGVFRMLNKEGKEMFDSHLLDDYNVKPGDVIHLESWDGWSNFLSLSSLGFAEHVINRLQANTDDLVTRFQMKVALYMAAHFGHVELAQTMLKQGCRSDEPVGEHPYRQWCRNNEHIDSFKAPVHEAVESGQANILQVFIHHNQCCIMAKDGNNLQPLNVALRQGQKRCASMLLQKQWSRVRYGESTTITLAIFARLKNWIDKSRDHVLLTLGPDKSTSKKRVYREDPLVGQGIYVNGYSDHMMSSRSKMLAPPIFSFTSQVSAPIIKECDHDDPNDYFRRMTEITSRLVPKQRNKWSRMAASKQQTSPTLASAHLSADDDFDGSINRKTLQASTTGTKLPPIKENKAENVKIPKTVVIARGESVEFANASRRSSKASHVSLLRDEIKQEFHRESKRKGSNLGAALLAKAKATENAIALPLNSIEDTPRPYFFVRHGEPNLVQDILKSFDKHRGVDARTYAIQSLAMSNSFKDKPWLQQVRMAMVFNVASLKRSSKSKTFSIIQNETQTSFDPILSPDEPIN